MSTGVLKLGLLRVCYGAWLSFVSRKEIYGMMLTFETEAIYYCFLNIWLTLGWTKKKNKKKKPNCGLVTERFGYVKRNGES